MQGHLEVQVVPERRSTCKFIDEKYDELMTHAERNEGKWDDCKRNWDALYYPKN